MDERIKRAGEEKRRREMGRGMGVRGRMLEAWMTEGWVVDEVEKHCLLQCPLC